jgi:hypothetical protein
LLLLLRAFIRSSVVPSAAAAATASSAAGSLLQLAHRGALCLLLRLLGTRRPLLLLLLRRVRTRSAPTLRRLLLGTPALAALLLAVALRPLRFRALRLGTLAVALALGPRSAVVLAARLAGALLVLADFFLHEPPRLLIQFQADLVVAAVGATLPSLGIGLPATGAKDGFRERHR